MLMEARKTGMTWSSHLWSGGQPAEMETTGDDRGRNLAPFRPRFLTCMRCVLLGFVSGSLRNQYRQPCSLLTVLRPEYRHVCLRQIHV